MARTDLKVPYAEKDEAKALGARWDPSKRVWYTQSTDLAPFSRWLASPGASPVAPTRVMASEPAAVQRGSRYFELECDCVPWEGCPHCQAILRDKGWDQPA